MPVKSDNMQVYTTLPKELVEKIDAEAKANSRTRSKEIAHIVKKHFEKKG